MHARSNAPLAVTTPEGELLDDLHKRLVRWHYAIAESAAHVSPETQAKMMREMMAALKEIGENPAFRATRDARKARRGRAAPVDEDRVARLRARAAAGLDAG